MSDHRYIDTPPEGAAGWRDVWLQRLRFRPRSNSPLARLARTLKHGLASRLVGEDLDRQRDFNLALLEMIEGLRGDLHSVSQSLSADLGKLSNDIADSEGRTEDRILTSSKRGDAILAVLDQKIENVATRVRDLSRPVLGSLGSSTRDDYFYRRLEEGMRGSESEIEQSLSWYVDLARDHQPVLDVGCGRGAFLSVCQERGLDVRGFDTNERSISELRDRGIPADLAGIPDCFDRFESGSVGSILASHVVEHLPVPALFALFTESWRVLRDGGLLMIETPNASTLSVSGTDFWRDPTHLAPRHAGALTLIGRELGFEVETLETIHPYPDASKITVGRDSGDELLGVVDRLNEILFGDQDLRLILRK